MSSLTDGRPEERSDLKIEQILAFWFGAAGENGFTPENRREFWFGASRETDLRIAERFGRDVERAARGDLDGWAGTPRGRLALILLLDQFTRNIHRGTARAFSNDARAQSLCLEGLDLGHDRSLRPCERMFFILPLEHAEDPAHQARCVALFEELLAEVRGRGRDRVEEALAYAKKHRELIERFGRFPHRNEILARPSTPEEARYLRAEGERFGQG